MENKIPFYFTYASNMTLEQNLSLPNKIPPFPLAPPPGPVCIRLVKSICANRLHFGFNLTKWMSQEFSSVPTNVVPFVNSKENYWTYTTRKELFKLFFGFFCYIYFLVLDLLCRRKSTDVFFISARNLFSSFLYNLDVFGEILKSNMTDVSCDVRACCLCCLKDGCLLFDPPLTP